jgi:uncharacterized protein (DUF1501 family)
MAQTLEIFDGITGFTETENTFEDDVATDGDVGPYYLFPTATEKNGGYRYHANSEKLVVDDSSSCKSFFRNLKAAALVLNNTDAIIAGTEVTGWDTHNSQGGTTGTHANLLRRLGWAMYALRKYFMRYGADGSGSAKAAWDDVMIVTLSEFGRTTVQNGSGGTDHAEGGTIFVGGGAVNGGVYGCNPNDPVPWIPGQTGSMFGVGNRYLKRAIDYRSVLGEIIRDHLGATPDQLSRIIDGYKSEKEGAELVSGGASSVDGTETIGELGLV